MFHDPFCQFPTFSRDFLEGLSELFSLSAEDRFERKKSFEQKSVFLNWISEVEQEHFFSGEKNWAGMPKLRSISPEELFEENNDVKKKHFFDSFRL